MAKIMKKEGDVFYYDKLPLWVRVKYYDAIGGKCQGCGKEIKFNQMCVHRLERGHKGGFYTLCPLNHKEQNCKFVCGDCHKMYHSGEPIRK